MVSLLRAERWSKGVLTHRYLAPPREKMSLNQIKWVDNLKRKGRVRSSFYLFLSWTTVITMETHIPSVGSGATHALRVLPLSKAEVTPWSRVERSMYWFERKSFKNPTSTSCPGLHSYTNGPEPPGCTLSEPLLLYPIVTLPSGPRGGTSSCLTPLTKGGKMYGSVEMGRIC